MTKPTILVVGMTDSVHVARWFRSVRTGPFRLVLLPVSRNSGTSHLGETSLVSNAGDVARLPEGAIAIWHGSSQSSWDSPPDPTPPPLFVPNRLNLARAESILAAIRELHPAILHSMEIQHAGYACLQAAETAGADFPHWLVSNWGSDLQLYRKFSLHRPVLERLARRMDSYLSECRRDQQIARELGYSGALLEPLPASAGFDFSTGHRLEDLRPPSQRREILIKGYHGWSGRALHVLSAIHLAAPRLKPFRIRIALASPEVAAMARMLCDQDGLDIVVDPYYPSHAEALARVSSARLTVSVGISDGIGTTTLEAMALSSFPIASCAACVDEWIESGRDGLIVNPHDVASLSNALVRGAEDDGLVDAAAIRNRSEVEKRWNAAKNSERINALYRQLLSDVPKGSDNTPLRRDG